MTAQEYIKIYLVPKALFFSSLKMYLNFLWYFVPIGALPLLFAGLKWNKNNLSAESMLVTLLLLSFALFIPCLFVCYIVHFKRSKNTVPVNLSSKEAGLEVAKIFP